jgi:hypothetical protein
VSIDVPAGAPLPQLRIEAARAQARRPDRFVGVGPHAAAGRRGLRSQAAGTLQSDPDRHVSRLLCPRRLEAGARWFACLVPAFDAGVRQAWGWRPSPISRSARPGPARIRSPCRSTSTGSSQPAPPATSRAWPGGYSRSRSATAATDTDGRHGQAAHRRRRWPGGPPGGAPERIVEMDGACVPCNSARRRLEDIPTR